MAEEQDVEVSMRATIGSGGWTWWSLPMRGRTFDKGVFVRFDDRGGRLVPVELYFGSEGAILSRTLQALPLGTIERRANSAQAAQAIRKGIDQPGPDLATAASYLSHRLRTWPDGEPRRDHWVDDMFWSQWEEVGVPAPPVRDLNLNGSSIVKVRRPDARLPVPTNGSSSYPDEFWDRFATVYKALAELVPNPAKVIAEENGVASTTVHRWTRAARTRGLLGEPTPGKAG